jgi:hypothetical protein
MIAYEILLRKAVIITRCLPAGPVFVQPPPFPAEIREQLLDSYTEDILRLQDLIGRDLSPWLEAHRGKRQSGGR